MRNQLTNNILNGLFQQYYSYLKMNFLQLLASGASILNFNFQSKTSQSVYTIPKTTPKQEGFQKVSTNQIQLGSVNNAQTLIVDEQATILNQILQNQRQQLINRYLQLNLRFLQGQIANHTTLQKKPQTQILDEQSPSKDENQDNERNQSSKKKIKKAVKCGHEDKNHYAKGLCNNCYHKYGRTKKSWNCPHNKLYAGGMCQNCYINMYNKKKRQQNSIHDQKHQLSNKIKGVTIVANDQEGRQKRETQYQTLQKPFRP